MGNIIVGTKNTIKEPSQISDSVDRVNGLDVRLGARRSGLGDRIDGIPNGKVFIFKRVENKLPVFWPFGTSGQGALDGSRLFSEGDEFNVFDIK